MTRFLSKWLCVNIAKQEKFMKLEPLFKPEDYVKKPLTEYVITPEIAETLNEVMFLDMLKTDYFFMLFLLPLGDIDSFLNKLGFKRQERSVYKNSLGYHLTLSVRTSPKHKQGYYLSTLNYPDNVKRISFEFEHMYRIDIYYKSQDERYSEGTYPVDFNYVIKLDKETYNIISIHHSCDLFNLNHVELHTSNSLKTFAHKLDYNIHRIEEEPLSSITIDEQLFNNVSLFDVVYIITSETDRIRSFTLSDIVQTCGFSFDRMIGNNMEHFMNIENIFDEDELKVIEMVYI